MSTRFFLTVAKIICITHLFQSCNQYQENDNRTMQLMDATATGVEFENKLGFDQDFNGFNYRNFYNGGGVAIGDINNDGLPDIYFTANMENNRLYLNKGGFRFEDITVKSGTGGMGSWSTGVSMVDINADGLLDIYVCNSGDIYMSNKQNELFINNGDLTFTESAHQYNLADTGFGTHASFFDYDKDGDLDAYLLNNSYKPLNAFDQRQNPRGSRDYLGGDKLMKNEGGVFLDISEEAGIYGSEIGFGLGVAVGDMNGDQWDDIFVSNDFFERDYLYINQKDGTFREELTKYFQSISLNSMGADMADINNDGKNDLFVTDMLPRENGRIKSKTTFMDWNKAEFNRKFGYHHQFSRNVLQLSSPTGYREVGRFSGVEATDWSWGALVFDLDNDGLKDIFVANGIYQDLTDQDYINYISNAELMNGLITDGKFDYNELSKHIPSSPITNNFFKNIDGQKFREMAVEFGLDFTGFSNGSAYGDLDNDGDLDLVINNVNGMASIYRNNTSGNSIALELRGETNTHGIGCKIFVHSDSLMYYQEQQPVRGFQSSVDPKVIVGLPSNTPVDIEVHWPEGKVSFINNISVNQTIEVKETAAVVTPKNSLKPIQDKVFRPLEVLKIDHLGSKFVDFDRDRFLYHKRSTIGPKLSVADCDGDGFYELFFPGSREQPAQIWSLKTESSLQILEDLFGATEGTFLDVDGDKDLDLIVGTGGVHMMGQSTSLWDRLYINENGVFIEKMDAFGGLTINTSAIATADFDADGDLDIFFGEGSKPMAYGQASNGHLFENRGNGVFKEVTDQWHEDLKGIGMISDALFADINGDGRQDLVITGEFMGVHCFLNAGKEFVLKDNGLPNVKGWWNTLHVADLDGDGDLDIVAGNHGLNSTFKASEHNPIALFVNDFDNNGFADPILTRYDDSEEAVPYATRNELIEQIAPIKKLYPDYKSYEKATVQKMFSKGQIDNSKVVEVNHLATTLFVNNGDATFERISLPMVAQLAPIYTIASQDFDRDGDIDLLLGGNLFGAKPQAGRYDATNGIFLRNEGNMMFKEKDAGFQVPGEIRSIIATDSLVIVSRNSDSTLFFSY